MDKRHLHHVYTRVRGVKPIYFLGIAVIGGAVCVTSLRANNQHMIILRDAVYTADKNNTDVQKPLKSLQVYVTGHMNTNLSVGNTGVYPPVQLKYTYDRLVKAQSDAVAQTNSQLYTTAQAHCEELNHNDFSGRNRVPCIEEYVQSHNTSSKPIPDALYKFSFATPRWSPDLAGFSMIVTAVSLLFFIAIGLANHWLRSKTK